MVLQVLIDSQSNDSEAELIIFKIRIEEAGVLVFASRTDVSVQEVKNQVQARRRYPATHQMLIFKGKELENESSLQELAIGDRSELGMILKKFEISIKAVHSEKRYKLLVKCTDSVGALKSKIEEITGIKVRAQTLHIDVSFTDDSLLSEIGIASSQCWRLEVKQSVSQVPSIHVSIKDEILKLINPLEVNRNTTVSTLKELVEIRSGHQAEKLNLVLGLHKPPFKSQATLEDYNVQEWSDIVATHLSTHSYQNRKDCFLLSQDSSFRLE